MSEEIPQEAKKLLDELAEDMKEKCRRCKVQKCPPNLEEIIYCGKYKEVGSPAEEKKRFDRKLMQITERELGILDEAEKIILREKLKQIKNGRH